MAVICSVCDYENKDDSPFCEKCGEQLKQLPENKYDLPIKMLRDIGNSLADKQMSSTQDKVEEAFNNIMEISQQLLDKAQEDLENNLAEIDNLPIDTLEELSADADEERSMEIFSKFLFQFQSAQEQINEGLSIAKDALQKMRSFSELETGRGKIDLERASGLLQQGLNTLEIISEESQEPLFALNKDVKPVPNQIIESMDYLEEVMNMMSDYMDTSNKSNLLEIIVSLDMVKDSIQNLLESSSENENSEKEESKGSEGEIQNSSPSDIV
ncbi:MAG TPA: hypothetical protein PL110_16895 [Candidatus Eremiobacteraeota bacterium]|nr:hypothetical protein [Candidatus Eremiobacteraeota bacterium]